jgi:nitrogen fixation/metabolism regulation signal transduction histidine kinase
VVLSMLLLRASDIASPLKTLLTMIVIGTWLGVSLATRARSRFHLRTLSNLLAALREGDYSFRVRGGRREDPFGEVILELNALTESLRRRRVDDLEATALLRKVMGQIDVAVFAFDPGQRLRLINPAGERMLADRAARLLGQPAGDLGLAACMEGEPARSVSLTMQGGTGRWELRRGQFRQRGIPHYLLVLSDVSRTLRAEELAAWKRLIRVIGHELNNSLAPIKSLAGSMERLIMSEPLPSDWQGDLKRGLRVISSRSDALNRFMGAYSKLAKLPQPTMLPVAVAACVHRVVDLETRIAIEVSGGPEVTFQADQDQLEQLLINLIRNAVDASLETNGKVTVAWEIDHNSLVLRISDEGPGLPATSNLFVPFFTTKPGGSGIGLFLCRQIAEGHGGAVTLRNRDTGTGCEAVLKLPLG